jgi:glycosyltransferase involved in cell wall biosynthesis
MIQPKISVIMTTFNNERYMEQTIGYVLNQTFSDFEFILFNDGSTDKTGEICEKYAKTDSRIRYISQKNQGRPKTLNKGIKIAQGKYFIILDSDDIFRLDLLEKVYNRAVKTEAEVIVFNWNSVSEDENQKFNIFSENAINKNSAPLGVFSKDDFASLSDFYSTTYTTYFNKFVLKKSVDFSKVYFPEQFPSTFDGYFGAMLTTSAKSIAFLNECLITYRWIDPKIKLNSQVDEVFELWTFIANELGIEFKAEVIKTAIINNIFPRLEYYNYQALQETIRGFPSFLNENFVTMTMLLEMGIESKLATIFLSGNVEDFLTFYINDLQTQVKAQKKHIKNQEIELNHWRNLSLLDSLRALKRASKNKVKRKEKYLAKKRALKRFEKSKKKRLPDSQKTRIFFDGTQISTGNFSGVGYQALGFISGVDHYLNKNDDIEAFVFCSYEGYKHLMSYGFKNVKPIKVMLPANLLNDYSLFKAASSVFLDDFIGTGIYIGLYYSSFSLTPKSKQFIVVSDTSYLKPELFFTNTPEFRKSTLDQVLLSKNRASRIIAISEKAKNDIIQDLHLTSDKIIVAKSAADSSRFYPRTLPEVSNAAEKYGLEYQNYITIVSNIEPRKNHITLVKAMKLLPTGLKDKYTLAIIGRFSWCNEELIVEIEKAKIEGVKIKVVRDVTDDDLPFIYSGAKMNAFPSLYEGFGLTPLEAMQCGTPNIVSNVSVMPEVSGEAGTYFDPKNPEEIKDAIIEVDSWSDEKRQEMIQKGFEQSKKFDWDKSALKIIKAAKEVWSSV